MLAKLIIGLIIEEIDIETSMKDIVSVEFDKLAKKGIVEHDEIVSNLQQELLNNKDFKSKATSLDLFTGDLIEKTVIDKELIERIVLKQFAGKEKVAIKVDLYDDLIVKLGLHRKMKQNADLRDTFEKIDHHLNEIKSIFVSDFRNKYIQECEEMKNKLKDQIVKFVENNANKALVSLEKEIKEGVNHLIKHDIEEKDSSDSSDAKAATFN